MNILSRQGLLGKAPIQSLEFCPTCVLGQQHRLSFLKGTHLAKACLEYVHANLWGLTKVQTHGGNKYFLSIIDDFSRKVWIFLLKSKDQTLESFKNWKILVEDQT